MGVKDINSSEISIGFNFLKREGIIINKQMTSPKNANKDPKPVWVVKGLTSKIVKVLEDLKGQRWCRDGQVTYSFYYDPTESIAFEVGTRLKKQKSSSSKNPKRTIMVRRLKVAKSRAENLKNYLAAVESGKIEKKEGESLEDTKDKVAYYESLVREREGSRNSDKRELITNISVGDFVKVKSSSVWHEVIRVNDDSFTLRGWLSIDSHTQRVPPEDIAYFAKISN